MNQPNHTKILGNHAETLVVDHLIAQGFMILERNYRKTYGEIDVIAAKKDMVVFVEVKARRSCTFDLSSVITVTKQRKIALVAREYIARHTDNKKVYRFDVALVEGQADATTITYIPHAFVIE